MSEYKRIWCSSQVVRPRSATPLSAGSNPACTSKKVVSFVIRLFLSKPQAWYIIAARSAVYIIKVGNADLVSHHAPACIYLRLDDILAKNEICSFLDGWYTMLCIDDMHDSIVISAKGCRYTYPARRSTSSLVRRRTWVSSPWANTRPYILFTGIHVDSFFLLLAKKQDKYIYKSPKLWYNTYATQKWINNLDKRPCFLWGGSIPIFICNSLLSLAKTLIPQTVVVSYPYCLFLCSDNWSWRFSVRWLRLKPHKEVLYVRGIVTYLGHNTSLLFYTASLLPLTLPWSTIQSSSLAVGRLMMPTAL